MKSKRFIGFSSLFLTAVLFGSFGIWIRLLSSELGTYQQIVFRNLFAFLFALVFIYFRRVNLAQLKSANRIKLISFTLLVPLAVILYVFAILETKISVVTFAFYAGTVATSWLLGITIFKEKIEKTGVLSLLLVLIGLVFLAYPFSFVTFSLGFIIAFLSGVVDSIGHYLRKDFAEKVDKFLLVLLTSVGGILVSGIMIVLSNDALNFFPQLSVNSWIIGGMFGFFLIAVNYLLLLGFQNFDLSLGSIVLVGELFFATLFGILFLSEFPTSSEIVGGFLIFIASILPNFKDIIRSRSKLKLVVK